VDAEPIITTDVLRWQAYRAALAAWEDRMDRAPIEIPAQRRSPEDGPMHRVPR
jgi:hypothetical protein